MKPVQSDVKPYAMHMSTSTFYTLFLLKLKANMLGPTAKGLPSNLPLVNVHNLSDRANVVITTHGQCHPLLVALTEAK